MASNKKMMKKICVIITIFLFSKNSFAQDFLPLWPAGKKPNSNGKIVTDSLFNERIWRVGTPGIYAFLVPQGENKGTSVIICPGGGYERLSHIYNGFQFAKWFNAHVRRPGKRHHIFASIFVGNITICNFFMAG